MKKLYTVRDVLIGYGLMQPAVLDLPNDEVAKRVVRGTLAKGAPATYFNTNPEDKELWCVGEFDEQTGQIISCQPRLVCKFIDMKDLEEVKNESN